MGHSNDLHIPSENKQLEASGKMTYYEYMKIWRKHWWCRTLEIYEGAKILRVLSNSKTLYLIQKWKPSVININGRKYCILNDQEEICRAMWPDIEPCLNPVVTSKDDRKIVHLNWKRLTQKEVKNRPRAAVLINMFLPNQARCEIQDECIITAMSSHQWVR